MKLSILMPVYNERTMVERCISQVLAAPIPESMERELVIVDDCSTDGTYAILERLAGQTGEIRLYRHERNAGKGAAVRTAIGKAAGDFAIVQDADLEYDPSEYTRLLRPLLDGRLPDGSRVCIILGQIASTGTHINIRRFARNTATPDFLLSKKSISPMAMEFLLLAVKGHRNIVVSGRRTSVRLEPEMWDGLGEICRRERSTVHHVCTMVSIQKLEATSLTAAIRVFVMRYFRLAATEEGHAKSGHGYGLTLGLCASDGASGNSNFSPRLTKKSFA